MPTRALVPPSLHAIRTAAGAIAEHVPPTPFVFSPALSELAGAAIWLKLENRQYTGSFKERGALTKLLSLSEGERRRGVIAMSAGNHAQAVAFHATRLGIDSVIVMPRATPYAKVRRTAAYGAEVVVDGTGLAEAAERAQAIASERGLVFVHPYDDPEIIAGQGTVGLEMIERVADLDAVLVPVGGGGLIAGCAIAIKAIAPATKIIGVQAEAFPSLIAALAGTKPVLGAPTIAEGIAVKSIGSLPLAVALSSVDDVVLVPEVEIENAIHRYLELEKLVVEGAGAASLAAILADPPRFAGKRIGVVVCGGNIDTGVLAQVINRARLREERVNRLRVEIADRPGELARVAAIISRQGANIIDVEHQRDDSHVSARSAFLLFSVETQRPQDILTIVEELARSAYPASLYHELVS